MNIMTMKKLLPLFFLIIAIFIMYNFFEYNNYFQNNKKENFTSGFRVMCRPHIRNIRLVGERYYNNFTNNIGLVFRKFGLI
jgi:hypothetical protein